MIFMGYKVDELNVRVSREIGKLKGNIKCLWDLSKQTPLNRDSCRNIILEIRKSLKILWELVQDVAIEYVRKLDFSTRFLFTIITGKDPEAFIKEAFKWPAFESDISVVISKLDSPEYYKDKEVRDSIICLVEKLEAELSKLELRLGLNYGILKMSEFLTEFPQFTENWAIATCYLTAMEIMVNNKLKELGLDVGVEFKDNYKKVLEKSKERGMEVPELEKLLPSVFWNVRNKVVHTGYSPTNDELDTITSYVRKVLAILTRLK
ncbi:MAG: hypothetical protein QXQ52_06595 [Candidatus Methanomethylicaceae archaeon]